LIRDDRMCLTILSKDVEGDLRLSADPRDETCDERDCRTLKTVHALELVVKPHGDCDPKDSPIPGGQLLSLDLTTAFVNADPDERGYHGAHFRWQDSGLLISGTLSGITNAGTQHDPLDPACQKCHAPGYLEGRFCGLVRKARDERLRCCNVIGIYKLQLRDLSVRGGAVQGVMEGVIVCGCD
jgi:hypothetical protein